MCPARIANRGVFADFCSVNFQFAHVYAQYRRLCYTTGNLGYYRIRLEFGSKITAVSG